jgi:hypothetical protein
MNPSLFPLLICVVLLLSVAPASSQDSSVLISQAGSAREPFDVSGAVTFGVPVVNSAGGSMRYTVDLTVGPDTDDYQVSDSFTKVITVNARSSSSAKFDVNFRSPKMSKGEFGKWASDKNDTTTWERAWYHAEITPLIGSTTVKETMTATQSSSRSHLTTKELRLAPGRELEATLVYLQGDSSWKLSGQHNPPGRAFKRWPMDGP